MAYQQHDVSDSSHRVIADRYRLETTIGHGAMGTVWSGTDELLHRSVAVKELKLASEIPEDDAAELQERALREARAMAVVAHPNVVMLYDVAWENNHPFVVMELVPAQSLAKILDAHGPLRHHQLALVVDGVAAALQAAHRIGIVHRDVKPGNVLISQDGQVKLSDFGVARNGADPTITRTGHVMGTPAFIAPEVAVGDPITTSADLWSLGTTLFRAAEGRLPYDNSTDPLITISSIINGRVPQHHQTGPIGEVISGLMVKDPARRMPLEEVRRRVHPLLSGGTNPFEGVLDPEAPALRVGRDCAERTTPRDGLPRPGSQTPAGGQRASAQRSPGNAAGPASATAPASAAAPAGTTGPGGTAAAAQVTPRRGPKTSTILIGMTGAAFLLLIGVVVGFMASGGFRFFQSPLIASSVPWETAVEPGMATPSHGTPQDGPPPDPYSEVQVENYSRANTRINRTAGKDTDGSDVLGPMKSGDILVFRDLDFGPVPAQEFSARLAATASDSANGVIEVRINRPDAEPIGKVAVTSTGGRNWKTVPIEITPVIGTHDVYLTFESDTREPIAWFNWFQFHQ